MNWQLNNTAKLREDKSLRQGIEAGVTKKSRVKTEGSTLEKERENDIDTTFKRKSERKRERKRAKESEREKDR